MPFTDADFARILKYQAYEVQMGTYTSVTLSQLVRQQLSSLETTLPELVPIIQDDLDTLDTLDTALVAERGSINSSLIKADVLEWEGRGQKTAGISVEFERIRRRIAQMLSQQIGGGGRGMGSLMRG
jgi:hypothetical protein